MLHDIVFAIASCEMYRLYIIDKCLKDRLMLTGLGTELPCRSPLTVTCYGYASGEFIFTATIELA